MSGKRTSGTKPKGVTATSKKAEAPTDQGAAGNLVAQNDPNLTAAQDSTGEPGATISGENSDAAESTVGLEVISTQDSGLLTQNESQDFTLTQGETSSGEATEKPESINGLEVISKQDGFRRAGRVWRKEATRIKFCEMTEEQYLALQAEPMLSVKLVTI